MRILIVEDNPDLVANLFAYLEPLGYTLDVARRGDMGLTAATHGEFDAIVLDLMLPGLDGVELCRRLRQEWQLDTPILMLTARDTLADKIVGFGSGADDYLVKPFSLAELDLRLKALVRRARGNGSRARLQVGDLSFERDTLRVRRGGVDIELTPTGYKLLAALMRAAPRLVTRESLVYEIWGDEPPDSDALRTHIHALRQAIDKRFDTALLKTVQGQGWRLDASTDSDEFSHGEDA
ncbi:MAG: response regulator transcription factor [Paucibacter sp.]|nr:response regulator transcription factor [Roseateles sp.]